jgi:ribosomal protein L37E
VKFADPLDATCARCGETGSYPVKTLLALEAKCAACGHSLSSAGESMRRLIREVENFSIAVRLTLEIEDLDKGIAFDDTDLEGVVCLNDIVALTERKFLAASRASPHSGAVEIVRQAVAKVFPGAWTPAGDVPLADAFPEDRQA